MDIIIVGGGKVGVTLTKHLCSEEHNIVLIDTKDTRIEEIVNAYDVMGVCGNGASLDVLREAGADKASLIIATTGSDELNILCCLIARKLGTRHSIARVRGPEYSKQLGFMRDELGISMMVNPELNTANEISRMLRFPAALKIESFNKGRIELVELHLGENSPLCGLTLSELYAKYQVKILVCAVERDGQVFIPNGQSVLQSHDRIHITASRPELSSFCKAIGVIQNRIRDVLIVGGGTIAYYLAQQLIDSGMRVKIIEQDEKRCTFLSEALPRCTIVCGDGTDQDVLQEEGLAHTDACVMLTGIDEENILMTLYARHQHVGKVITKVNRSHLVDLMNSMGSESIVSPQNTVTNMILQYVRAKHHVQGGTVRTLYRLVGGQVEALEFSVSGQNRALGTPLCDLKLKSGLLIACIVRGNKIIIPNGQSQFQENDSVIVITQNQLLRDFDDILA